MKILKVAVVALVALSLPVAMGGQGILDLGDHGAAHAKKGENGKSNSKSSNGKSGSAKSDNGRGGGRDKSSKGKSSSSRKQSGNAKSTRSAGASKSTGKSKARGPGSLWKGVKKAFSPKSAGKTTKTVRKAAPKVRTKVANSPRPKTAKTAKLAAVAAGATVSNGALSSQLKSLNSLNRNINGLMNSNDPKMDPFRDFVVASAESEEAQEALESAREVLENSQSAVELIAADLGISGTYPEVATELAELVDQHAAGEPLEPMEPVETPDNADVFDDLYAQWESDHAAWETEHSDWQSAGADLTEANTLVGDLEISAAAFEDAEATAQEAADATSEDAMRQAMIDSLNATGAGPVTESDITPEMEAWVADRLGVGDADGLVDDYIAREAAADDSGDGPEEDAEGESVSDAEEDTSPEDEVLVAGAAAD